MTKWFMIICIGCLLYACGESKKTDYLETGWGAFSDGDYLQALSDLQTAKIKNPHDPEIRTALGWTYLRLDSVESADREFADGAQLGSAPVDLAAGWTFVLAAIHGYNASNVQAAQVLTADPNWVFAYAEGIDYLDIRIVKAENHYLLGEFASSLIEIKIVNPDFDADVSTVTGRIQLASEIEKLRALNKSPVGPIRNYELQ